MTLAHYWGEAIIRHGMGGERQEQRTNMEDKLSPRKAHLKRGPCWIVVLWSIGGTNG